MSEMIHFRLSRDGIRVASEQSRRVIWSQLLSDKNKTKLFNIYLKATKNMMVLIINYMIKQWWTG